METFRQEFFWKGRETPPTGSNNDGTPWRATLVGSATVAAAGGDMVLTLIATNEAESARLSFGDVLGFDIDDLAWAEFDLRVDAAPSANVSLAFGVAGTGNATITSIGQYALFQAAASTAVTLASKDGTNPTQAGIATGLVLPTTRYNQYRVDFEEGVRAASSYNAVGGKSDVRFLCDNASGNLRPVGRGTVFSLGAYTAGVQPYVQLQKASSTDTAVLRLRRVSVGFRHS